jgi:hypothetical protein
MYSGSDDEISREEDKSDDDGDEESKMRYQKCGKNDESSEEEDDDDASATKPTEKPEDKAIIERAEARERKGKNPQYTHRLANQIAVARFNRVADRVPHINPLMSGIGNFTGASRPQKSCDETSFIKKAQHTAKQFSVYVQRECEVPRGFVDIDGKMVIKRETKRVGSPKLFANGYRCVVSTALGSFFEIPKSMLAIEPREMRFVAQSTRTAKEFGWIALEFNECDVFYAGSKAPDGITGVAPRKRSNSLWPESHDETDESKPQMSGVDPHSIAHAKPAEQRPLTQNDVAMFFAPHSKVADHEYVKPKVKRKLSVDHKYPQFSRGVYYINVKTAFAQEENVAPKPALISGNAQKQLSKPVTAPPCRDHTFNAFLRRI